MSLINCPECNKEVSDSALSCIHCGYPLEKESESSAGKDTVATQPEKAQKNLEGQINRAIDAIFALIYIYLLYSIFFTDQFSDLLDGGAAWFGLFIGFVVIYFVQKMLKAILGTIGRSFDSAFNKNT
jgi:hypothetical protein